MKGNASQPELGGITEKRIAIPRELMRLAAAVGSVLVVLTLSLALDRWHHLSGWVGWPMMEALGTVSAVLVAVLLAWWEGTRSSRRQEQERAMVRKLLEQEIRQNDEAVREVASWLGRTFSKVQRMKRPDRPDDLWRTVSYEPLPAPPPMVIRESTLGRLTDQLDLYCRSVTTAEAEQIDIFYEKLQDLEAELASYTTRLHSDGLVTVQEVETMLSELIFKLDQMRLPKSGNVLVRALLRP